MVSQSVRYVHSYLQGVTWWKLVAMATLAWFDRRFKKHWLREFWGDLASKWLMISNRHLEYSLYYFWWQIHFSSIFLKETCSSTNWNDNFILFHFDNQGTRALNNGWRYLQLAINHATHCVKFQAAKLFIKIRQQSFVALIDYSFLIEHGCCNY